jgi:manganese-dependent inorganic pyrophosphatase
MVSDYKKKDVILVDHNSYEESIDGLHEANILEIVDHHCLGTIGTHIPISFISRPVGCTATIIYDEFRKERVEIPKDIAGMLVSAIISDTLVLTSPTTTDEDIKAAEKLAKIAGIDLKKFGKELFKESTSIKGLSIDELIKGDFKTYQINGGTYGIAVITTSDFDEIKDDIPKYVTKLNEMHKTSYDGVLMFILDIFKEGSYVLFDDDMKDVISSAFSINNLVEGYFIKGLISRKKQILPAIIKELEK